LLADPVSAPSQYGDDADNDLLHLLTWRYSSRTVKRSRTARLAPSNRAIGRSGATKRLFTSGRLRLTRTPFPTCAEGHRDGQEIHDDG
jgi:hypothetical protein